MLAGIRSRLTFANVISLTALFIALGAGAYAAVLAPSSVKSRHIADGQVKAPDIIPSEVHDLGLTVLDTGGGGLIPCIGAWFTPLHHEAAYYRDPLGQVHLTGVISACGAGNQVFTLPEGFRPALSDVALPISDSYDGATLSVRQDGTVSVQGHIETDELPLNGLSFRCGPSGQNGCA